MTENLAPLRGRGGGLPWDMHLRAYDAFVARYGVDLAEGLLDYGHGCRGGFCREELDYLRPGWEAELDARRASPLHS